MEDLIIKNLSATANFWFCQIFLKSHSPQAFVSSALCSECLVFACSAHARPLLLSRSSLFPLGLNLKTGTSERALSGYVFGPD
jgi:hypothetical protein